MSIVASLEKLYRKKLCLDYFGCVRSINFIKYNAFDTSFLREFHHLIEYFKECVYVYGICQNAKDVYDIYNITSSFLYKRLYYYIKNYCIENYIPFDDTNGYVCIDNTIVSNGKKFIYNLYELDNMLSSFKKFHVIDDSKIKFDYMNRLTYNLNKKVLGTNDLDIALKISCNNVLFDKTFLLDFYLNESYEIYNLLDYKKIPFSLISYELIDNNFITLKNNINDIIIKLIKKYCEKNFIMFYQDDSYIYIDNTIIGNNDYLFFNIYEIDNMLSNLTLDNHINDIDELDIKYKNRSQI